jgi:hypothetical protein
MVFELNPCPLCEYPDRRAFVDSLNGHYEWCIDWENTNQSLGNEGMKYVDAR